MAGMRELARMAAAQDMMGSQGGPPSGDQAGPQDFNTGPSKSDDFMTGLDMIEAAIADAPPELQQQAHQHIQALREIAESVSAGRSEESNVPQEVPMNMVPGEADERGALP